MNVKMPTIVGILTYISRVDIEPFQTSRFFIECMKIRAKADTTNKEINKVEKIHEVFNRR